MSMHTDIEFRPLTAPEIPAAKRLILSVAHGLYQWPESLEETIRRFEAEGELRDVDEALTHYAPPGGTFLVALDAGRLIGTGAVRPFAPPVCELKRLWLLEDYQGRGIGFEILQRLMAFARGAGYTAMRLTTDVRQGRAVGFYRRLGFERLEPETDDPDEVLMRRAL
jgi:putative acetyltransferase